MERLNNALLQLREQCSGVKHLCREKTAWRWLFFINVPCSPSSYFANYIFYETAWENVFVWNGVAVFHSKLIYFEDKSLNLFIISGYISKVGNREWESKITVKNPHFTLFPQYRLIPKQLQHIPGFSSGLRETPLPSPTVLSSIVIWKTSTCTYINSKNTPKWLFIL